MSRVKFSWMLVPEQWCERNGHVRRLEIVTGAGGVVLESIGKPL